MSTRYKIALQENTVPYLGATTTVDLGSQALTTTGAITGLIGNFTALYVNTSDFYVDSGKIGIATDTPATKIDIWSTAVEEKASLGSQWLTGGTWTVPTGWTDNGDGTFTHAGSATNALVYSKLPSNGTYYYVAWAVSGRTTGTITISMGGQGTSGQTASSYFGLKASDSVNKLTITPISSFDGTISISAFVMTPYSALETITDSFGVVISERRSTDSSASQFIGTNCGRYTYNSYNNNGYGTDTFASLTTGHDNNAFGKSALPNLTYGVYNNAIGSTSLYTLTYGAYNVSIGHQAQYFNKTGSHNIGIGYAALYKVTGTGNVGIGSLALGTTTGSYNIGLGFSAGRYSTGNYQFYVNHKDQGTDATEKANSLMYGVMNTDATGQTLQVNAKLKVDPTTDAYVAPTEAFEVVGNVSATSFIGSGASLTGIMTNSLVNAKGDLISATADNTPAILNVGTDGQVLTADSSASTGLSWRDTDTYEQTTLIKSGDYVYIRTRWTDDYDLVQKMSLVDNTTNDNNVVNFVSTGTIPVATTDISVPSTSYTTTYQYNTDDVAPVYINDNYIGGNHGTSWAVQVTVTGHDKTAVDIGSKWKSSAAHNFTLMKIYDANTIVLLTDNYGTGGTWDFYKWFSGSVLYHVSGATHTGNMTFSGALTHQLKPSVKGNVRKIFGKNEIVDDGVYKSDHFDIVNSYGITDIPSLVTYFQSQVGNDPDLDDPAVDNVAGVDITYRFHENGSCTIYQNFHALKTLELGYVGFTQAMALTVPTSGTLHEYVPKVADFNISGTDYKLEDIQDITSLGVDLDLTTARWTSATNPPDRFIQLAKTSGGDKHYGFAIGYNTQVGYGIGTDRKDNVATAGLISSAKKQYPKIATGLSTTWADSMLPADTIIDGVTFRCPINYEKYPNATNVSWYYVGYDVYLNIDYHATTAEYIELPNNLVGRKIEVVESNGVTIGNNVVTSQGIFVSVTDYGTAILKLT